MTQVYAEARTPNSVLSPATSAGTRPAWRGTWPSTSGPPRSRFPRPPTTSSRRRAAPATNGLRVAPRAPATTPARSATWATPCWSRRTAARRHDRRRRRGPPASRPAPSGSRSSRRRPRTGSPRSRAPRRTSASSATRSAAASAGSPASTASPPTASRRSSSSPPTASSAASTRDERARPVLGAPRRRRRLRRRHRDRVRAVPDRVGLRRHPLVPGRARRRGAAGVARLDARRVPDEVTTVGRILQSRRCPRSRSRCAASRSSVVEAIYCGDEPRGATSCSSRCARSARRWTRSR